MLWKLKWKRYSRKRSWYEEDNAEGSQSFSLLFFRFFLFILFTDVVKEGLIYSGSHDCCIRVWNFDCCIRTFTAHKFAFHSHCCTLKRESFTHTANNFSHNKHPKTYSFRTNTSHSRVNVKLETNVQLQIYNLESSGVWFMAVLSFSGWNN